MLKLCLWKWHEIIWHVLYPLLKSWKHSHKQQNIHGTEKAIRELQHMAVLSLNCWTFCIYHHHYSCFNDHFSHNARTNMYKTSRTKYFYSFKQINNPPKNHEQRTLNLRFLCGSTQIRWFQAWKWRLQSFINQNCTETRVPETKLQQSIPSGTDHEKLTLAGENEEASAAWVVWEGMKPPPEKAAAPSNWLPYIAISLIVSAYSTAQTLRKFN